MSIKTKVNLTVVTSPALRSGVSTRLAAESLRTLFKEKNPTILALSPTAESALMLSIRLLVNLNSVVPVVRPRSFFDSQLLDLARSQVENLDIARTFVARHTARTLAGCKTIVVIDSDGVFDHPGDIKKLVDVFRELETPDGEIDIVLGVHQPVEYLWKELSKKLAAGVRASFILVEPNDDTTITTNPFKYIELSANSFKELCALQEQNAILTKALKTAVSALEKHEIAAHALFTEPTADELEADGDLSPELVELRKVVSQLN